MHLLYPSLCLPCFTSIIDYNIIEKVLIKGLPASIQELGTYCTPYIFHQTLEMIKYTCAYSYMSYVYTHTL